MVSIPFTTTPATPPRAGMSAFESASSVPTCPPTGQRLLWVDDNRPLLTLYQAVFESLGFEVMTASSPREALQLLNSATFDVAILDYDMPEMNGGMLACMMKGESPRLPVILHSGNSDIPASARLSVDAVCPKSSPRQDLLAVIESFSGAALCARDLSPLLAHHKASF